MNFQEDFKDRIVKKTIYGNVYSLFIKEVLELTRLGVGLVNEEIVFSHFEIINNKQEKISYSRKVVREKLIGKDPRNYYYIGFRPSRFVRIVSKNYELSTKRQTGL